MNIWVISVILAIMNNIVMSIYEQVFVWIYVLILLVVYRRVELIGHMVTLYLSFWGVVLQSIDIILHFHSNM